MKRNRPQTEQRIVDAAINLIVETGFIDFGINAIAAKAGADKVLIYRYFGGTDGLLKRIGDTHTLFPPAGELLDDLPVFIENYRKSITENHLAATLMGWAHVVSNPLTEAFIAAKKTFWNEARHLLHPQNTASDHLLDVLAELPISAVSSSLLTPLLEGLEFAPEAKQTTAEYNEIEEELPTNLL